MQRANRKWCKSNGWRFRQVNYKNLKHVLIIENNDIVLLAVTTKNVAVGAALLLQHTVQMLRENALPRLGRRWVGLRGWGPYGFITHGLWGLLTHHIEVCWIWFVICLLSLWHVFDCFVHVCKPRGKLFDLRGTFWELVWNGVWKLLWLFMHCLNTFCELFGNMFGCDFKIIRNYSKLFLNMFETVLGLFRNDFGTSKPY